MMLLELCCFSKSYSKNKHLIIPALDDVKELLKNWKNNYCEYASYFKFNSLMEELIYASIVTDRLPLKELYYLLNSESLVSEFMDIWKTHLKRGDVQAGVQLLVQGLRQLKNLKEKGLPKDSISLLIANEITFTAFHREMKRQYWQDFLVCKGESYEWDSFEIQHGKGYFPPIQGVCGLSIIIYCENIGEAAVRVLKNEGEKIEHKFVASYQVETAIDLSKNPLKIPFKIEYKLDKGSDAVLILLVGFAMHDGTGPDGNPYISWNRLA